jgi:4-aminobutyrate aminotransferase-like enzyme
VLRLAPPLTIETSEIDRLIEVLDSILRENTA